ncbi:hypothetical protein ACTXT7_003081 [Hymenolepis weldensis]
MKRLIMLTLLNRKHMVGLDTVLPEHINVPLRISLKSGFFSDLLDVHLYSGIFGISVLLTLLVFFTILWRYRRSNSYKEVVWKTIDSFTSSYIIQSRLRTPHLPAPLLSSEKTKQKSVVMKKEKYLKLDDTQWSPSAYKLRLEERIAYGSYGDVFCGILLTPMTFKGKKEDEKMVEKQVVAKVLNDVFLKEKMMEFANEVAILRLIGVHPNIIQFMGCAQRSSKL